jgi:hypothetical protein
MQFAELRAAALVCVPPLSRHSNLGMESVPSNSTSDADFVNSGGLGMRAFAFYCVLGCWIPALAHGKDFSVTAASGQVIKVQDYKSWKNDCTSTTGTVRVLTKPQHGTLSTRIVDSTISSHTRIPRVTYCTGVPIKAFRVNYASTRGFHGTDNFSLEAVWPSHSDIDNYVITVR